MLSLSTLVSMASYRAALEAAAKRKQAEEAEWKEFERKRLRREAWGKEEEEHEEKRSKMSSSELAADDARIERERRAMIGEYLRDKEDMEARRKKQEEEKIVLPCGDTQDFITV